MKVHEMGVSISIYQDHVNGSNESLIFLIRHPKTNDEGVAFADCCMYAVNMLNDTIKGVSL